MGCNSCNETNSSLYYIPCEDAQPSDIGCASGIIDSQCIVYKGNDLECLNIGTGTRLESIIQLIDNKICQISGTTTDYSSYNTFCLTDLEGESITTQKEFVESISSNFCSLKDDYEYFKNTTFVNEITDITNLVNGITSPNLTSCAGLGITGADNLVSVLTKMSTAICTNLTNTTLSGVDWEQCVNLSSIPTTVSQGFDAVIDMICSVKTIAEEASGDTYMVKVSAADNTARYLETKIVAGCGASVVKYNDSVTGEEKLRIGFITDTYTFNPAHFSTSVSSVTACGNNISVSLNPDVIGGSTPITCSDIDALFQVPSPGTLPNYLYGKFTSISGTDVCQGADFYGVRNWLFQNYGNGDYIIRVNNNATVATGIVTLVPYTPGSGTSHPCAAGWVDLSGTMDTSGSIPGFYTYTMVAGGAFAGGINYGPASDMYPKYRWNTDGSLQMRGHLSVNITDIVAGTHPNASTTITFRLGYVTPSCMPASKWQQGVHLRTQHITDGSNGFIGTIESLLYLDVSTGEIRVRINFSTIDTTLKNFSTQISLDGVRLVFD